MRVACRAEDFGSCEFTSDYDFGGLKNLYRTFGLGIPLIAIRASQESEDLAEGHCPSGVTFPVTVLLRVLSDEYNPEKPDGRLRCVLELHDSSMTSNVRIAGRLVPLETDLSTPLALFLEQPCFKEKSIVLTAKTRSRTGIPRFV